jgi:hypothetical protein
MLIGVNTTKYTAAITIGAIILPRISPNFTQALFKGDNNFELIKPRIKKINAKGKKITLGPPPLIKGHNPIIKNTAKNNRPKPLLLFFDCIKYFLI